MAHTPGPWTFALEDDGITDVKAVVFVKDHKPGRAEIAQIEAQPQVEANARLIAAAPDLLVAAKAALNARMYKDWPGIADLLIAAIVKAEGE